VRGDQEIPERGKLNLNYWDEGLTGAKKAPGQTEDSRTLSKCKKAVVKPKEEQTKVRQNRKQSKQKLGGRKEVY